MDDQGNEFALFYRDRDNAEEVPVIIENSDITITLERFQLEIPRVSPGTFCLVFHIWEKYLDILIANKVKFIDNTITEVVYDQVCQFEFESKFDHRCAIVTVEYTIFQCALLACVGVIIEKIDEDEIDDIHADIMGKICASFKVRDGSCSKHVLCSSYSRREFGNFVKLGVFGVPTYSSLFIKSNVTVNGEQFTSTSGTYLEFEPQDDLFNVYYEEVMLGEKVGMRILVKWGHAIYYLPEADVCEWRDRTRREVIEDRNWEQGNQTLVKAKPDRLLEKCRKRLRCIDQKNFRPISIRPSLEALTNRVWCISNFHNMLVEVFSISVCYEDDLATLGLFGTINVKHVYGNLRLFNRDKKNPQLLHSFESIPLKSFGRCIHGPNFCMEIDLKDRRGDGFCHGYVGYNFHTVKDWLNRRLCSTLKGKKGFVTVHYTIFDDALQLKLKFVLMSNSSDPIKGRAFGRIDGRYGNFRYNTHYDKNFYQITLFDKNEDDAAKIVHGEIPLSKPVVVVPLNSEFLVMAHIFVLIEGECETLKYTYEATFNPNKREISKILSNKIQGSNFSLSMFVECG
ncbi:uncharacterized protein LOC141642033 [Silene latifolia]|uniref:uncharacterized protein LOC141642033 n=1 Tax=Silene latifolia TaxID=37657 RepID=UPI003D77D815